MKLEIIEFEIVSSTKYFENVINLDKELYVK